MFNCSIGLAKTSAFDAINARNINKLLFMGSNTNYYHLHLFIDNTDNRVFPSDSVVPF